MADIEKIRVLHDLKTVFGNVDPQLINELSDQIKDLDLRNYTDRFFRSFQIEYFFQSLFCSFPWVKLLHGLDETQFPERSKSEFQVPDFVLFFEDSKKQVNPILVDVKGVVESKMILRNIMSKQVDIECKYAETMGIPLLYAIYWEKFQTWTLNSSDCFTKRTKTYTLDFFTAFKNDLFTILGDLSFFIDKKFYRKTICDSTLTGLDISRHHTYGGIEAEYLSLDNVNWQEVTAFECSVIDSNIRLKEISVATSGTKTTFMEESEIDILLKTSTMVLRNLAIFRIGLTPEYSHTSMHGVDNLMKLLGMKGIYMLPHGKSKEVDDLMKLAFLENSSVYRIYRDRKVM